jgi:hypothetical protein
VKESKTAHSLTHLALKLTPLSFLHTQIKAIPTNIQEKSTWVANNAKNAATKKAEVRSYYEL